MSEERRKAIIRMALRYLTKRSRDYLKRYIVCVRPYNNCTTCVYQHYCRSTIARNREIVVGLLLDLGIIEKR